MTYEVQFQHEGAEYKVIGPDIDGMLKLILGLQDATIVPHVEERRDAAEATLKGLKYEWRGGEQWAPPIGPAAAFLDDIQPGWIAWAGGLCPVPSGSEVEVCLRSGVMNKVTTGVFSWEHRFGEGDIVRYRVCE